MRVGIAVAVVATAVALVALAWRRPVSMAVAGVPDVVDFNFHVKPLLSDRCFKCHGPDDRVRKAGLRLDIRDAAFGELPSGRRAVVAGDTRRSELVRRILSTDPKVMMPAPDSHLALSDVERAIAGALDRAGRRVEAALGLHPAGQTRGAADPRHPAGRATRWTDSSWPRSSRTV